MRIVKSLALAGIFAVAATGAAHAQWYLDGEGGASFLENSTVTVPNKSFNTEYNTGYALSGAVGYSYGSHLSDYLVGPRTEFEVSYRSNDADKIGGISARSGTFGALGLMLNGLLDFLPDSKWHPFIGAGVGAADLNFGNASQSTGASAYKVDDWQFAYQGIAGLAYDVVPNWQLKVDYRYFATMDPSAIYANNSSGHSEYKDHSIFLGVTYKFAPPPPPPPAPAPAPVAHVEPPPPPPPAPAPAPAPLKNFIVFFDFDKSTITSQAKAIIEQAAQAAKDGQVVHIQLTGYTDLAGGVAYNQKLSERRANAVKAELVKMGVSASEIDAIGKGKNDPLVPTKDGVREPQNRRVEIMLK